MHEPDNTYAGRRTDLDIPTLMMIRDVALHLAENPYGFTTYNLSEAVGCSKEWARKILLRMEKEGKLEVIQYSQLKVYRKIKKEGENEKER